MKTKRARFTRILALPVVAFSLLAIGPCLTIAEQSVINGFFNAVTPLLVDQARQGLGLPAASEAGTAGSRPAGQ